MGFFSSLVGGIGRAFTGAVRAIGSCVSGAFKTAGRALAHVAGAIGGNLGKIFGAAVRVIGAVAAIAVGPLGPVLGPIVAQIIIEAAAKVIAKIAKSLGIIEADDKVEEIGYRLEEACAIDEQGQLKHPEWKRLEDFDNLHDYYAYLKVMIPDEAIDYGKLKQNRIRYTTVGAAALTDSWGKVAGIEIPDDFVVAIGRADLKQGEVQAVVNAFKSLGFTSVRFNDFLLAKGMAPDKINDLRDAIIAAYQEIYPDKTGDDIRMRIHEWRQAARDDTAVYNTYKDRVDSVAAQADRGVAVEDIDFQSDSAYTEGMR
ncbi:hypothetical protein [Megasphaera sp.]|uniref:hypothetical protein n=1 Tax=Megasphaera sp. TaxID=2023260 RepID=UPI0027B948FA|nr:hypothetical protein [Megasphaera sp.]